MSNRGDSQNRFTRREVLLAAAAVPLARGAVIGEATAAKAGERVLTEGGNVVDAAVTAALVAGVVALPSCGIGGYGGHMVIAIGGRVTAIDFNTTAPAKPPERVHQHGWLSAGVPGTLAGLELAVKRYGKRTFRQTLEPAIRLAAEGFPFSDRLKNAVRAAEPQLRQDAGSAKLLLGGGETFRNPDLAAMLEKLADDDSAESFYRGEIGRRVAEGFARNGGAVTAADLADYRAREVKPIEFRWRGHSIYTPAPTSGGETVIQALGTLNRGGFDPQSEEWDFARLEALRIAWFDRLRLLGDPEKAEVPLRRLLSDSYADESADRVRAALRARKPLPIEGDPVKQTGTIHLSAADQRGDMVALTLTHGDGFGARVTVDGMGLILGHGLSRFDPRPGHPNSLGARKRPLHNMCPTIVVRDGRPVLAVGATGGRRIPNSLFDVITRFLAEGRSLPNAVAAGRMNTTGGLDLLLDKNWTEDQVRKFAGLGYQVRRASGANVSGVARTAGGLVTAQG